MIEEQKEREIIKLVDSGWVVEIMHDKFEKGCYSIEKIFAFFGHGQYFPIDTSEFTDEQWDIFHERLEVELRG